MYEIPEGQQYCAYIARSEPMHHLPVQYVVRIHIDTDAKELQAEQWWREDRVVYFLLIADYFPDPHHQFLQYHPLEWQQVAYI